MEKHNENIYRTSKLKINIGELVCVVLHPTKPNKAWLGRARRCQIQKNYKTTNLVVRCYFEIIWFRFCRSESDV
jgi:hypothetical protein